MNERNKTSKSTTKKGGTSFMKVDMRTVAARAGVAPSSVSRVLSGHADVSESMRRRVLDAVGNLGYEPNLLAQSMRRGATQTIGFVVGNISNPLFASIALGAERRLREKGFGMVLANSFNDRSLDESNIRLLSQRRVDGLMLSLTDETSVKTASALERSQIPTVMVDREPFAHIDSSAVFSDHANGIESAVSALVELGHQRIALINGTSDIRPARERAAALRRACRRLNVSGSLRSGEFSEKFGYSATMEILQGHNRPTAIIAGGNQILGGVLAAFLAAGVSIPDDMSLITCDDVALSQFLRPALATISRDTEEIGEVAATLLLEEMSGQSARTVVLPTGFRMNKSCAAP